MQRQRSTMCLLISMAIFVMAPGERCCRSPLICARSCVSKTSRTCRTDQPSRSSSWFEKYNERIVTSKRASKLRRATTSKSAVVVSNWRWCIVCWRTLFPDSCTGGESFNVVVVCIPPLPPLPPLTLPTLPRYRSIVSRIVKIGRGRTCACSSTTSSSS